MHFRVVLFSIMALVSVGLLGSRTIVQASPATHKLAGHVLPSSVTAGAKPVQLSNPLLDLAVRLRVPNLGELANFIEHLYTPGDPMYQRYITPDEFARRFGASQADLDAVAKYFSDIGCLIQYQHPNRLLLDVQCRQAKLESALNVKISHWQTANNELIRTIDTDPSVPEELPIEAIHGLTTVPRHPHYIKLDHPQGIPLAGTGPNGGLAPSDIKMAYSLNMSTVNGHGQSLGLFELDGYVASDVTAYENSFGITRVPLTNVLVDGFNGSAGSGAAEVTLDIELMTALAPGATRIIVYEGPNTDPGVLDTYQRIATDNIAKQVSTSWGISEDQNAPAETASENTIFMQLAAQGQSVFAASGDSGAFDNGISLSVDDPASQPFVTGAGGTTLTTNADHSYSRETTWFSGTNGGGGGISAVWKIPSWQAGLANAANLGSTTMRNVPDVALNADPATGYAIFVGGTWNIFGGTSCAAPLWAAFTALVNQQRAAANQAVLGYANPQIYSVAKGPRYGLDFHDVADHSTNGHFPAVSGYDLATGWGSLDGANLIADLAPSPSPSQSPSPSPSPSHSNPPSGGCNRTETQQTHAQQAGSALSFGLPFLVGAIVRRRKKG